MLRIMIFDGENCQDELDIYLQSVAWALHSIVGTMSGYIPEHLVFLRDMIIQNAFIEDWKEIK